MNISSVGLIDLKLQKLRINECINNIIIAMRWAYEKVVKSSKLRNIQTESYLGINDKQHDKKS